MIAQVAGIVVAFLSFGVGHGRLAQFGTVEGTIRILNVRAAGAVVYLIAERHSGYTRAPEPPVIDQLNLRFVPRVLVVLPGTTVEFRNSDPLLHNVFGPGGPGPRFDLGTYPRNERRSHRFDEHGAHVILCHVHPEMVAYVVAVPTPYHAVVDEAGHFRIEEVPAGRYTLRVWQRRIKPFRRSIVVKQGQVLQVELAPVRAQNGAGESRL